MTLLNGNKISTSPTEIGPAGIEMRTPPPFCSAASAVMAVFFSTATIYDWATKFPRVVSAERISSPESSICEVGSG